MLVLWLVHARFAMWSLSRWIKVWILLARAFVNTLWLAMFILDFADIRTVASLRAFFRPAHSIHPGLTGSLRLLCVNVSVVLYTQYLLFPLVDWASQPASSAVFTGYIVYCVAAARFF